MAQYICEYCGCTFTRKPGVYKRTRYKKIVCRNPECRSKYRKYIWNEEKERRGIS